MMGKKLNPMIKQFCREYIIDLNGKQAAIRAGYSKKTAASKGSQLLTIINVQEYIAELQEKRIKRTEITADMVVKELALIAFSDTGNLFTEEGGLTHISSLPEEVTRTISEVTSRFERPRGGDNREIAEILKIKCYDKKGALDSLGKHLGIFEKDNKREFTLDEDVMNWLMKK